MKKILRGLTLLLLAIPSVALADDVTKERLLGTWENAAPDIPKNVRQLKFITPTHFIWVTYDREMQTQIGMAGGTWSLKEGVYRERIEFTSDEVRGQRGKEFSFTARINDGKWLHQSLPNTGIVIDEVW